MILHKEYLKKIISALEAIADNNEEQMKKAIDMVADVIQNDGIIYIFGCGHSHLVGLDSFYRAGAWKCVCNSRCRMSIL